MVSGTPSSSTGLSPRVAGPLAYAGWWVTGVILWSVERRDRAIRFHAAQSVGAFGVIAAAVAGVGALGLACLSVLPSAFLGFRWASGLTWGIGVLVWIVAMYKAATGHAWRIPVAADLADRLM